jgi:hypothetical protein
VTAFRASVCAAGVAGLLTISAAAQIGGKVVTGNPTPGTPQPEPPNLADRVTVRGCLQLASGSAATTSDAVGGNTVINSRFELTGAERQNNLPADTGGSPAATAAVSGTYRLAAIESQLSPFVGTKVEISGELLPRSDQSPQAVVPTLQVEFVQKLSASCQS